MGGRGGVDGVERWAAVQRLQRTSSLRAHSEASTKEVGGGGGRGHGVLRYEKKRIGGDVGGVDGAGDHRVG
jgi:hypothetical protein